MVPYGSSLWLTAWASSWWLHSFQENKIQKWKFKNEHQRLHSRNLITLKNGDSSKLRNLSSRCAKISVFLASPAILPSVWVIYFFFIQNKNPPPLPPPPPSSPGSSPRSATSNLRGWTLLTCSDLSRLARKRKYLLRRQVECFQSGSFLRHVRLALLRWDRESREWLTVIRIGSFSPKPKSTTKYIWYNYNKLAM